MPLQVVGQRAEENVTSDSIIGLVVDGPHFELVAAHGLAISSVVAHHSLTVGLNAFSFSFAV